VSYLEAKETLLHLAFPRLGLWKRLVASSTLLSALWILERLSAKGSALSVPIVRPSQRSSPFSKSKVEKPHRHLHLELQLE
jgi:hypothetical protein